MISQERLEEIARHWAVGETLRRGYECEPRLTEFPGGWVVWSPPPAGGAVPEPGSGETVIIDRETGALTVVPGLPPQVAMSRYAGPPRPPRRFTRPRRGPPRRPGRRSARCRRRCRRCRPCSRSRPTRTR
ncbi:hypothetical protein ACFQZ4_14375 [Catellatospora coxensis]